MKPRVVSLLLSLMVVISIAASASQAGPTASRNQLNNSNGVNRSLNTPSSLLYDNGPINGTIDAWTINFGYVVANTYTIAGPAASVQIGLWAIPGDTLTQVSWAFGSGPNMGDYSSGTSPVTFTVVGTNAFGYTLAEGLFNVTAPAGSGWLSIYNAVVPSGDPIYWDENDGPSLAWESAYGYSPCLTVGVGNYPCSESFQIYGGSTPEPGTLVMFGTGLVGLAGVLRRKVTF